MTLKQLEAFYWAASGLNFAVAAERLHLSVSTLSKRISELEESLNVVLFDRTGRGAELTPDGKLMVPRVRELLAAAEKVRRATGGHRGLQGRLRIGMGEMSALTWLSPFVRRAHELHPDLEIEPHVGNDLPLQKRVEDGELDCAVLAVPSDRIHLAAESVGQAGLVWVASPSLIAEAHTDNPKLLLQTRTFICLPAGSGPMRIFSSWLTQHHLPLGSHLHCNSWGAVVGLIAQGMGFGLMPQRWAEAMHSRGALDVLPGSQDLSQLHYMLHWRRDDTRRLLEESRNLVKEVVCFTAPACFV